MKDKLIQVRVDEETKAEWAFRAKAEGMSLNKWIRYCCSRRYPKLETWVADGIPESVRTVHSADCECDAHPKVYDPPKDRYLDGQDPGPAGYEVPKPCCPPVFIKGKRVHGKGCTAG